MHLQLTKNDKAILLTTVRETIESRLFNHAPHYPEQIPISFETCGAFVTIKTRGILRGCIGRMVSSDPLSETLKEMAIASAFQDPRFPPVTEAEWLNSEIEISILSPMEIITDLHAIIPGKHGIIVSGYGRSGVLLPQVATEYKWDRETFILQTLRKAGLSDKDPTDIGLKFEIFTDLIINEKD